MIEHADHIISFLLALATLISTVGALMISWHNANRIQDVHLQINSRMDQLLRVTKEAAMAAGISTEKLRADTERQEHQQ